MNLKATKRYVDKYTHDTIEAGTILAEVPDQRAEELFAAGVAEPIEEPELPEEPEE